MKIMDEWDNPNVYDRHLGKEVIVKQPKKIKWFSQEELLLILDKPRDTPFMGTEASDDIKSQIIEELYELIGDQ